MSADSATLAGRAFIEGIMTSTCVITRVIGQTFNESTMQNVPETQTIYSGKCRLRFPFVRPEQVNAADQVLAQERGVLSLPIDTSSGVLINDIVVMTVNPLDAGSAGMQFRIDGPFTETHATSRRFAVEVVS